jgi:FkbM family methyltransferase
MGKRIRLESIYFRCDGFSFKRLDLRGIGEGGFVPLLFFMKVAHFSIFGPNQCGLYHTAKDLILAERSVGIDAQMVGLNDDNKPVGVEKDGDFETVKCNWALGADVLVRHTLIPTNFQLKGIPIVMALHGRPESSLRLEVKDEKNTPILSIFDSKTKDMRHKAFVCFWEEYMDIWRYLLPERKLFFAQAPINLNDFTPDIAPYDFGVLNGEPNILIADIWREDVVPFNVLFAAAKFIKKHPKGRIHIVGVQSQFLKAMHPFFRKLRERDILGLLGGQQQGIKSLYAASDVVITPHVIATRVIRESLAMGKPVIAGAGCKYTPYTANPMDVDGFAREIERWWSKPVGCNPRRVAEKNFKMSETGTAMKKVFEYAVTKEPKRRKVFIDIGGHIGETIRQFCKQVADHDEYEIYSFEPDPRSYKILDSVLYGMKNLTTINACLGAGDGMVDFYCGGVNYGEGSTAIENKQTGGVDYDSPVKVECIDFGRWLKENIKPEDYVVVKMNIEGGEYDLMELLLDRNLTGLIDKAYIQLHAHKFPFGEQRERFNKIEARFWREAECTKYMSNKGSYSFV